MAGTSDVVVVGLGGMGSAAAAHLAARGLRVAGFDRHAPPHSHGSSHGGTRVIRQAYFEHPAYVPMLVRAYELWRELEQANEVRLLELTGGLMMGGVDSEVVTGTLRSARGFGLPHESLDTGDLRRRYPQFSVPDGTVGVLEERAGFIRCEAAVEQHLLRARRFGADLHLEEPVVSWRVLQDRVEVRTARGTYEAGHLVLTPGPWAPTLLAEILPPAARLRVERQVYAYFDPPGGIGPYRPEVFPVFIWEKAAGNTPYGFPAADGDGGGVKVAFYRHPHSEECTPETVDRRIHPTDEAALRSMLREFLPGLDGPMVRAGTCLYTLTPDLNFIIDHLPGAPRVVVAAGFSGHGFKFCSVVGEIVADLVSRGESGFDLSLFSARRWGNLPSNGG